MSPRDSKFCFLTRPTPTPRDQQTDSTEKRRFYLSDFQDKLKFNIAKDKSYRKSVKERLMTTIALKTRIKAKLSKARRSVSDNKPKTYFTKMKSSLKKVISQCEDVYKLPPKNVTLIDKTILVEQIRNRNYSNTCSILQDLNRLNSKDLRRNYNYKILSQDDEKLVEDQAAREYKYAITDPNRTAALFERTQSIFKLLMQMQLKSKINYEGDRAVAKTAQE